MMEAWLADMHNWFQAARPRVILPLPNASLMQENPHIQSNRPMQLLHGASITLLMVLTISIFRHSRKTGL